MSEIALITERRSSGMAEISEVVSCTLTLDELTSTMIGTGAHGGLTVGEWVKGNLDLFSHAQLSTEVLEFDPQHTGNVRSGASDVRTGEGIYSMTLHDLVKITERKPVISDTIRRARTRDAKKLKSMGFTFRTAYHHCMCLDRVCELREEDRKTKGTKQGRLTWEDYYIAYNEVTGNE